MTLTSKKIIFFGTEDHSLGSLKALVEGGFSVAAVVTKPDAPRGRGQKLMQPPVKTYALEHGIPVWQPQKLSEITQDIKSLEPVTGVLVAYGKIIPQSIIDLFTPGIINLHPSLLPLYRGPSPIEAAITSQDEKTGVSIMLLEAGMDSGPVYLQEEVELRGTETKPELYKTLFSLGEQMLVANLTDIMNGKLAPVAQDHTKATYCHMLSKKDSLIRPEELTASQAEARVRAHLGFPRTRLQLNDSELIITKAHVSQIKTSPLSVRCSDGKYLIVDELIAPSGKTMPSDAFMRGYNP